MRSGTEVRDTLDHLFRHHAGQVVSVLARRFGIEHIQLIEDSVQEAMITAMKRWPLAGVPENPFAWLTQAAKNRAVDQLRRGKWYAGSTDDERFNEPAAERLRDEMRFPGEIAEDHLRMMFACCSPAIPPDSQVALTLKVVSGFGVSEIARAYLASEDAVAKLLTRAKQKLRTAKLDIPAGRELRVRLDAVLRVLYLMFNEGYSACEGDQLIRRDLCFEAIRLAEMLASHPAASLPKVHAAAALFVFQAARLTARTDIQGDLLLLADQDRSKWDKNRIARGLEHFRRAAAGDEFTQYHLEAEIASLHSLAPDFASTDWERILRCYNELQSRKFSPVVELNRIVAIGHLHGPDEAIAKLEDLGRHYLIGRFNLFHVARGHFLAETKRMKEACAAFERALTQTRNKALRRFIQRRIGMLTSSE